MFSGQFSEIMDRIRDQDLEDQQRRGASSLRKRPRRSSWYSDEKTEESESSGSETDTRGALEEWLDDPDERVCDALLASISWTSLERGMNDWVASPARDTSERDQRKNLALYWMHWLDVLDKCDEWPAQKCLEMPPTVRHSLRSILYRVISLHTPTATSTEEHSSSFFDSFE